MRKLVLAALAAGALAAGGSVFAQASNYDAATQGGNIYNPPYPLPRRLEPMRNAPPEDSYWNSGNNPYRNGYPYGYDNADRYGYRYGYPPAVAEGWGHRHDGRNDPRVNGNRGHQGNHRGNRGDRDGDGVRNNVDRHPNDPSRW